MRNLDEIYEYINQSRMTLVINNNKKDLLNSFCRKIYNQYKGSKSKISTNKGLFKKLSTTTNKFMDINKIQLSSSKSEIFYELLSLKKYAIENSSNFLFKYNRQEDITFAEIWNKRFYFYKDPKLVYYDKIFDLIILIDKKHIEILKGELYNNSFDITKLVRRTKLKKLELFK